MMEPQQETYPLAWLLPTLCLKQLYYIVSLHYQLQVVDCISVVKFSKRRNGIMKKTKENNVRCYAHISLVIFSGLEKMFEYCSPSTAKHEVRHGARSSKD